MKERRLIDRLLFVYNADSGPLAAIVDSAKKLLSINGCPLCSLTHSLVGERSEWKSCKDTLGVPIDYVHRNEITSRMHTALGNAALPCVLAQSGDDIVVLLTSDTIQRCNGSIADLRGRLGVHAAMRELAFPADAPQVRESGVLRAAVVR